MQLKHLNLTTSDVGGLASFFERFFGFKRLMTRGQDAFALMCNQDEFVLTLMKAKKQDSAAYPETFHVGFYVDAPDAVRAKHDELAQAGLSPGKIQIPSRGGSRVTLLQRSGRCRDRDRHATWAHRRIETRCRVSQCAPRAVSENAGRAHRPGLDERASPTFQPAAKIGGLRDRQGRAASIWLASCSNVASSPMRAAN
jgi:hypothetical protein